MLTTTQRFKKLLDIAKNNGYDIEGDIDEIDFPYIYGSYPTTQHYSVNDLVLNTNFFKCLFKNSGWVTGRLTTTQNDIIVKREPETKLYEIYFPVTEWVQYYKFQWVAEKDNALDWLFKQFNI